MNNPYAPHTPVFEQSAFFGRGQTLEEIASYLRGNQSIALVGPEKMGKTSLLMRLARPDARAALGLGEDFLLVYLSCSQLSAGGPGDLFGRLSEAVNRALVETGLSQEPSAKEQAPDASRSGFEGLVRRLNQQGLKLVILLDDFEHLGANPEVDRSFFNALRSAAGRFQLALVTASAKPLIELTYARGALDILSSPFFNIFAAVNLGLLSDDEARSLIRGSRREVKDWLAPEQIEAIFELVGGHPWGLQLACSSAWETGEDMAAVSQHVGQEMSAYFLRHWEHLSEDEQRILRYLATDWLEDPGTTSVRVALRDLTEKGLLVPETGSYRFASRAWAEFVADIAHSSGDF